MKGIKRRVVAYLESLRFPWLLLVTALLCVVSVCVPGAFPFVDGLVEVPWL